MLVFIVPSALSPFALPRTRAAYRMMARSDSACPWSTYPSLCDRARQSASIAQGL